MKNLLTFLLLTFPVMLYSQKQANVWFFADHIGIDFNASPPAILQNGQTHYKPGQQWNEGSSSICDNTGALLFYTDGEKIWNKNHVVMPNGGNLLGNNSSTGSSIIAPLPGSSRYFYVFVTDAWENDFKNGLTYSIVDMCLDSQRGDVVGNKKNIQLLNDTVAEKLACVRHDNGRDYWILTHKFGSNAFYAFLLSDTGIAGPVISNTGIDETTGWGGQMVVSPNGKMIGYAVAGTAGFIADFNAITGIVSNPQTISEKSRWGVAFSPDNSKLYMGAYGGEIIQYDLMAGNTASIIASGVSIPSTEVRADMRLGPDGNIYITKLYGKKYLSAITNPNVMYPACNFVDSFMYFGGQTVSYGLPNVIAGYQYSNTITDCSPPDTPTVIKKIAETSLPVFPNPAYGNIIPEIHLPGNLTFNLAITDLAGRNIYEARGINGIHKIEYPFPTGTYIIKAIGEKTVLTTILIKQ